MSGSHPTYEKLDPIGHIHRRPDMYIGSCKPREIPSLWVLEEASGKLREQTGLQLSEGLIRLFIEVLSNAVDNVWRSNHEPTSTRRATKIVVTHDPTTHRMRVWNDGISIPQTLHEKEQIPIPELIFGHLLTGSNMDDTQKRLSSGRNGLGIKLVNVFSQEFGIELVNEAGELYRQSWSHHMRDRQEPRRTSTAKKKAYTQVEWRLDFRLLGCEGYSPVLQQHFQKLCIDASMMTGLPVIWNDRKFVCKSFLEYIHYYLPVSKETEIATLEVEYVVGRPSHYGIVKTPFPEYREISFVNGIFTAEGGIHVDLFQQDVFRQVTQRLRGKRESMSSCTVKDIKPYFLVFANVWLENPEFSSQSKTKLIACASSLSLHVEGRWIDKLMKWSFVSKMEEMMKSRELLQLKKTEKKGGRSGGFKKIEGLDQANLAGGKKSALCTLILCEGLSAKTFAVKGIGQGWNGVHGRDYFGIYALRGKLLNVRNSTVTTIAQNREITDMIQALNLRYHVDYTNEDAFRTLRYGKVLILTDADADGHHICSLLINCFHHLFPSLLSRKDPFLWYMMTPIATIRMSRPVEVRTYYDDRLYQKALQELSAQIPSPPYKVKYFKGLGTSSDEEIRHTFGRKVRALIYQGEEDEVCLQRVFHKTQAQDRKEWLSDYDPDRWWILTEDTQCRISDYLNQELIQFSLEDCRRSLPNLFDGLKVSQRKILYSVFKKHLTTQSKSMKVAQLAGYCAEVSNYHHGEQCLFDTIIKMAHGFPGSNNLPLLQPDGQFGSRAYGGKDAASARYIFTKMSEWTRCLFPEEDDALLTHVMDDGDMVEPEYYLPILPTILGNGCVAGIGTGWSCSVPCYSFDALRHVVEEWLDGISWDDNQSLATLTPWYQGFHGTMERVSASKYRTTGVLEKVETKKNTWRITELPLWCWTNKYKEDLETLLEQKKIAGFRNYSTADTVLFEVDMIEETVVPTLEDLKLVSYVSTSNMVLFVDGNTKLQKMESVRSILELFCDTRLDLYRRRKEKRLLEMEKDWIVAEAQRRFLQAVQEGTLDVYRKQESWILQELERQHFPACPSLVNEHGRWKLIPITDEDKKYDYLLRLSFRDLTESKLHQLETKIQTLSEERQRLQNTRIQELWKDDLSRFARVLSNHHHPPPLTTSIKARR